MYENYVHVLEIFQRDPSFAIAETWTTLPFPICYKYPLLTQFYIFKWYYQDHNPMPALPMEEIHVDKEIVLYGRESLDMFMKAGETLYIFSQDLFENLVKDLIFFSDIRLISKESMQGITKELEEFLDYLEELTIRGTYKETGNKIGIYISEVEIDTNYSLIESGGNYLAMLRTLVMTSAATTDDISYQHMKNWFTALKRLSTHISVSGEKERIQYFKAQREIIKKLKQ
ncbi:MAG: hypothetical protein LUE98_05865 [Tannerellaceae bacterium]|nr:hypothetical protein [Tannerellaceae bacterium]